MFKLLLNTYIVLKAEGKADWVVPTGRLFHLPTNQSSQPTHAGISNTVMVFLSLPSLCQQQIHSAGGLLPSLHWGVAKKLSEAFLGGLCVWWEDGISQSRWMPLPTGQCRSCQQHRHWDLPSRPRLQEWDGGCHRSGQQHPSCWHPLPCRVLTPAGADPNPCPRKQDCMRAEISPDSSQNKNKFKKKKSKKPFLKKVKSCKKLLSSVWLCFLIAGALRSNHTAAGLGAWGAAVTPLKQEWCTFMPGISVWLFQTGAVAFLHTALLCN